MQHKKCLATLGLLRRDVSACGGQGVLRRKVAEYGRRGVVLTVVVAALSLEGIAASPQLDGVPDRAGAYNILHLFMWAKNPTGNLIFDAAGNLYGTTAYGGGGCGVVWKLARDPKGAWAVSILHAFTGADGCGPMAGLIFDAAGNLYGTTAYGGGSGCGGSGCGVVFKLKRNPDETWTESVLYSFTGGVDGDLPSAGLIFDAAGNLYGTTYYYSGFSKPGVVFKLAPNPEGTWTESVLYSFTGEPDGGNPNAALVLDAAGTLYGTTFGGGSGVVFKLKPNADGTWTESVLYNFTGGADGASPGAELVFDAAGNLYSTTVYGGAYGYGVVFKLAADPDGTWTESVLHSFTGGADGSIPVAGLIFDAAGSLYGTTAYGGGSGCGGGGCGVVFKLKPSSTGWNEAVLHTFLGFGKYPMGSLIFDAAGDLYGTASDGNRAFDYGLVFEITRPK